MCHRTYFAVLLTAARLVAVIVPVSVLLISTRGFSLEHTMALDAVEWQVATRRYFSCRLTLASTDFGTVDICADAGNVREIRLDLYGYAPFRQVGTVSVEDAPWQHGNRYVPLSTIYRVTDEGIAFDLGHHLPALVENLYDGLWLNIEMADPRQPVFLRVSTTGISEVLPEFQQCLDDLLPVNFAQIRSTQLLYDSGQWQLTASQMKTLRNIARYIQADKRVSALTVDGHTDASGDRLKNLRLSRQRADAVRDYLVEVGVVPSVVTHVRHHGQRYPAAGDATRQGRAKNRRVMITLERTPKVQPPASMQSNTSATTPAPGENDG